MFLSDFYYFGQVVEKDEYMSFEWCKKSAEQSYYRAQSNLGEKFFYGRGIKK
ncbi:hypothetical protein [Bartonella sp. HY328]|uniref:hypothetical protein n=1 Tax=unclassified Bartonella TaxID=2645622 RepID=UPI003965BD4C